MLIGSGSPGLLFFALIGCPEQSGALRGPMSGCHTVIRRGPAAGLNIYAASSSFSLGRPVRVPAPLVPRPPSAFTELPPPTALRSDRSRANPLMMLKLIVLAALAGFTRASDVLEFTDNDFESKIGDHELILVEFFAPW